jgi:hypothetical protein
VKAQLTEALIAGDAGTVNALTQALLASGVPAREILDEALLPGMEVVGERMRSGDCFIPEVLDRRVREDWEERGSRDLYATCLAKARDIIREHVPEPVPDDVAARVRAIVEETDRAAGVA